MKASNWSGARAEDPLDRSSGGRERWITAHKEVGAVI
jgi:hypothetical protein